MGCALCNEGWPRYCDLPPTPRGVKEQREWEETVSIRPQCLPGHLKAKACHLTLIRDHFRLTMPLAY
jgi:hypothetical protein